MKSFQEWRRAGVVHPRPFSFLLFSKGHLLAESRRTGWQASPRPCLGRGPALPFIFFPLFFGSRPTLWAYELKSVIITGTLAAVETF